MHAFVTAILLGMAWLDPFDADAEPEPPNRQLAQVEESVSGSERNTVIAADVGGQAALLKKPFKHDESVVFFGGRKRLTGEEKTAGVIGHGQRAAVLTIAEQELTFVIGAPKLVGLLAEGYSGSLSATPQATTALDQAVAIQHRMNRALGGDGDAGEPPDQALADLTGAPTGVFALHVQDKVLHLKGNLMSIAIGAAASVRQPLNATFLIAIEDLVAGFAGNSGLPAELGHRLPRQAGGTHTEKMLPHL